jgi:hypothetical protein
LGSEFIVASTDVLDQSVAPVMITWAVRFGLQSAHRSGPGREPAVVTLDMVLGVTHPKYMGLTGLDVVLPVGT